MKRKRHNRNETQLGLFPEISHLPQWASLPETSRRTLRDLMCLMILEAAQRAIATSMTSELDDE